ncbi:MAG: ester cyclase [Chloroflexota bacterium]|nr:ester cyclase [Chloroflexota bacterium]
MKPMLRVFARPFRWLAGTPLANSLRFRLTLLVLLAALPALGLLLLTASEQRTNAIEAAELETRRVARLAAANQNNLIDETQLLLNTLARLPEVRGNDPTACNELLINLVASEPRYNNLGVVYRDGTPFCTGLSEQAAGRVIDFTLVQRTLENGGFTIGTYQTSFTGGQPTIFFALPVPGTEGTNQRLVFAALNLGGLDDFSNEASLQPGSTLTIFDADGTVILRVPDDPNLVGRLLRGTPEVEEILNRQSGVTTLELSDGKRYIYAFERVVPVSDESFGTSYISLAVPEETVLQAADDTFQRNLGRLGIVALLSIVAAWVLGDVFVRRDSETRKSLVSELYQAFNSGNVDTLDDMVAADYVDRSPAPGQARGIEGVKQVIAEFKAAFPDGTIVPQELLADRDKVVARVTLTGTHVADFFGVPPSGAAVTADGIETFRFAGGLIVESWSMFGELVPILSPEISLNGQEPERERRGLLGRLLGRSQPAAERSAQ